MRRYYKLVMRHPSVSCYAQTSYAGEASVMAVQVHNGVAISIATKRLTSDVAVFSFLRTSVSLATNHRFFSLRCKSRFQRDWLLATSTHPSISMCITIMSLLQTSLKRGWGSHCDHLPVASSLRRMAFGILPWVDCYLPCFAVAVRRSWNFISRSETWAGYYERSAVAHATCLPSSCHRCCLVSV